MFPRAHSLPRSIIIFIRASPPFFPEIFKLRRRYEFREPPPSTLLSSATSSSSSSSSSHFSPSLPLSLRPSKHITQHEVDTSLLIHSFVTFLLRPLLSFSVLFFPSRHLSFSHSFEVRSIQSLS